MSNHDLILSLRVAFRAFGAPTTTEAERSAILNTMVVHMPAEESHAAASLQFYREKALKQQLLLTDLLTKNPPSPEADGISES